MDSHELQYWLKVVNSHRLKNMINFHYYLVVTPYKGQGVVALK